MRDSNLVQLADAEHLIQNLRRLDLRGVTKVTRAGVAAVRAACNPLCEIVTELE